MDGSPAPPTPGRSSLLTPPGSGDSSSSSAIVPINSTPQRTSSSLRFDSDLRCTSTDSNRVSKRQHKKRRPRIRCNESFMSTRNPIPEDVQESLDARSSSIPATNRIREIATAANPEMAFWEGKLTEDPHLLAILESWTEGVANELIYKHTSPLIRGKNQYVIGSAASCDIRLDPKYVDHKHCTIYPTFQYHKRDEGVKLHIHDRGTTGVWVNNVKIKTGATQRLRTGDVISFCDINNIPPGRVLLRFLVKVRNRANVLVQDAFNQLYITKHSDVIGTGSFGRVVKVRPRKQIHRETKHLEEEEEFACKVIDLARYRHDITSKQALYREISVQMALQQHPCILEIKSVLESPDTLYIVMELGKDGDLFEYLQRTSPPPTEDELRIIFDQIFHAVKYMHEQGMIHRDLKLENVIMTDRSRLRVKLGDFGMARFEASAGQRFTTQCGTIVYSAPERVRFMMSTDTQQEFAYTKAADVWSLGVMLYAAIARNMPFTPYDTETMQGRAKLANLICSGPVTFEARIWQQRISPDAKDLLLKMLEKDHTKRPTIQEVIDHPWLRRDVIEDARTDLKGYRRCPELVNYLNNATPAIPSDMMPSASSAL